VILTISPPPPAVPVPGHVVARAVSFGNAAVDGLLMYADSDHKRLVALGPDGRAVTAATLQVKPYRLFAAGDTVYATTEDKSGVAAVKHSSTGFTTTWTVTLPDVPFEVAEAGGRVFASLPSLNAVVVLNAATGAPVGTIHALRGPVWLAADGNHMVVGSVTDSTLTWFDAATLRAGRTVRVPNPSGLVNTGTDLLISSTEESSVALLDLTTFRLRASVPGVKVGTMAATGSRIAVATYGDNPRVVMFDRDLRQISVTPVPDEVVNLTPLGATMIWNIRDVPVMTAVPMPAR
jgi:hypothetical protein